MDGFQHSFMRPPPPPPPSADPNFNHHPYLYHQHHHHLQSSPPPLRAAAPCYPGQFQYNVSEPPFSQPHWNAPPPLSEAIHANPYSIHNPYHVAAPHQYPQAPPPHLHPHLPSQLHQNRPPYAHSNQEHENSNFSTHQTLEYAAYSNEEDWAAKARAWASANTSADTQHSRDQFTSAVKLDAHGLYRDQYPQNIDHNYSHFQHQPHPPASIQQYPIPPVPPKMPDVPNIQESASIVPGSSFYASDRHTNYGLRDECLIGQPQAGYKYATSPTSLHEHKQEVPSSYSSVSANGGQEQPHLHERCQDLAIWPLNSVPKFSHDYDRNMKASYPNTDGMGCLNPAVSGILQFSEPSMATVPGRSYNGTISATAYPFVPPPPQLEPSVVPSLLSHASSTFGRILGPGLQSSLPPVNPTFSHGAMMPMNHTFSGDIYGVPERPKKASMPNWLREEIIKKKAEIVGSDKQPKDDSLSVEDEVVGKSSGVGVQAESSGMGSSKSNEEAEDEDYVEEARIAAMNQEIKRVLTDILLKVTDEIFDEIATKVLNEEDMASEGPNTINAHHSSPSPPAPKASAKVFVPVQPKEGEALKVGGRSSSGFQGDVLGLASYASDDDNDEIMSTSHPTTSPRKLPSKTNAAENGSSDAVAVHPKKHSTEATGLCSTGECQSDDAHAITLKSNDGGEDTLRSNDGGEEPVMGNQTMHIDDPQKKKLSGDEVGKNDSYERSSSKKFAEVRGNSKNNSSRKFKDHDLKHEEKVKGSDLPKQSPRLNIKKDRIRAHDLKEHDKKDNNRRRERERNEKSYKSSHKAVSDLSRHKRRRSPSSGSISRNSNDSSPTSHASRSRNDISNSKRKVYPGRQPRSPSLTISGRRKVSRSPHSKYSHRSNSPYSSNEASRGRPTNWSRSPTRRRR